MTKTVIFDYAYIQCASYIYKLSAPDIKVYVTVVCILHRVYYIITSATVLHYHGNILSTCKVFIGEKEALTCRNKCM